MKNFIWRSLALILFSTQFSLINVKAQDVRDPDEASAARRADSLQMNDGADGLQASDDLITNHSPYSTANEGYGDCAMNALLKQMKAYHYGFDSLNVHTEDLPEGESDIKKAQNSFSGILFTATGKFYAPKTNKLLQITGDFKVDFLNFQYPDRPNLTSCRISMTTRGLGIWSNTIDSQGTMRGFTDGFKLKLDLIKDNNKEDTIGNWLVQGLNY